MSPLRPRVDRCGASDGVTGMQFPAYEWAVAAAYKVLGLHESIPQVVNWLIFAAGVLAFYALARRLSNSAWAGAVAVPLAWYVRAVGLIQESGLADFRLELRRPKAWLRACACCATTCFPTCPSCWWAFPARCCCWVC